MAATKIGDIRTKSADELNGMLLDLRKEQFNLRFQRATGQLEALSRINYDLVLMDCQMPELDGFEATSLIRSSSTPVLNHGVPVIAMTANAMAGDRERCLRAGMDDYLAKPLEVPELLALLQKWTSPAADE